jgi:hypothetical protein
MRILRSHGMRSACQSIDAETRGPQEQMHSRHCSVARGFNANIKSVQETLAGMLHNDQDNNVQLP